MAVEFEGDAEEFAASAGDETFDWAGDAEASASEGVEMMEDEDVEASGDEASAEEVEPYEEVPDSEDSSMYTWV
jgi:hypothetical protein